MAAADPEKELDSLELRMNFGKRVREARKSKKMAQIDVAEALGLRGPQPVNKWENARSIPDSSIVGKLGKVLGKPPWWFFLPDGPSKMLIEVRRVFSSLRLGFIEFQLPLLITA